MRDRRLLYNASDINKEKKIYTDEISPMTIYKMKKIDEEYLAATFISDQDRLTPQCRMSSADSRINTTMKVGTTVNGIKMNSQVVFVNDPFLRFSAPSDEGCSIHHGAGRVTKYQ